MPSINPHKINIRPKTVLRKQGLIHGRRVPGLFFCLARARFAVCSIEVEALRLHLKREKLPQNKNLGQANVPAMILFNSDRLSLISGLAAIASPSRCPSRLPRTA